MALFQLFSCNSLTLLSSSSENNEIKVSEKLVFEPKGGKSGSRKPFGVANLCDTKTIAVLCKVHWFYSTCTICQGNLICNLLHRKGIWLSSKICGMAPWEVLSEKWVYGQTTWSEHAISRPTFHPELRKWATIISDSVWNAKTDKLQSQIERNLSFFLQNIHEFPTAIENSRVCTYSFRCVPWQHWKTCPCCTYM